MRFLLVLTATLFSAVSPIQTNRQDPPDLIVVKFSCGQSDSGGHMIRSVQEPDPPKNEPIRIQQTTRNEPQEVINRRDLSERRAELRAAEINATLSKQTSTTLYFYRLEIRNTSEKTVKSFAWSYQPSDALDPSDRQFFCVVKAKPSEAKTFELYSPLAPSRVVDAAKANSKSTIDDKGKVMINQVEYADGSIWKRPQWNPKTFATDDREKVASGKCIGL